MDSRNNTWGRGSLLYALEGAVVGLAAGAVSVAYRLALEGADQVLDSLLARAKGQGIALAAWFCALCLLAFAVHCLLAWQPAIGGGGIPRKAGSTPAGGGCCWPNSPAARCAPWPAFPWGGPGLPPSWAPWQAKGSPA